MKRLLILSAVFLLFSSSSDNAWEKTRNGILIKLKSETGKKAQLIKLEVIDDQIIHVVATPSGSFSQQKSLSAIERPDSDPAFFVTSAKGNVVLSTSKIKASVSLITGQIVFSDSDNRQILKEPESGGKLFTPVNVEGTDGYIIQQVFESPEDEAFYGLGQHQSDEFNYKGLNEILYQYNTKVSVPFIVSSKNYGILWDNYSVTRFGDPREYSDLDLFKLYDNNGNEGGLTATYFNESDTTRIFVQRKETSIDYENLTTIKKFPEEAPLGRSRVMWNGKIEPGETGLYHFKLYYAGYVKVFINGELVVPERWRTAWNPNTYKFSKNMEKGKLYSIRVDWKPDGGTSYLGLKVLSPVEPVQQKNLTLTSEMGDQIDYYFIHGNNPDSVISGYREVTGKATIMPKWAMGYWQSRERYKSQDELINVVKEYRKRNIPLDNIVLDWSYWPVKSWGSHEFDPKYFPDPTGMVDEVHKLNARIMISVWPKFYITTEHFREFDKNGWMYKQAVKDSIRDWIGKGYIGSFYDPYSQGARDLFWGQIREHLYSKGFDAWWMDASEPDIESNASIEYRKQLSTPTALGPSAKYFNTYALMNAMAIYNGQRSVDPDKRVFLLTRSGFSGLQRYSTATWSGDIATRWEDMKAQIPAGLNFAISGIPYWTMDIGGFCVENRYAAAKEGSADMEEWRELNTRWYQFGSFCPLFRSHGQFPLREIYNLSPETHPAYKSMVFYNKLRYRLMPYIYSLTGMTYFKDYTIMRPLIMDFNGDLKVNNISDQYMFGPSLMVAPVYKYKARSREVYFPASGGWYDFYSGKYMNGGQNQNMEAPYERIPLFVREGTILPMGSEIQFTDENPAGPLTLYVYTGKDSEFTLYEDEGTNYNYEKGAYSNIRFHYNELKKELTIDGRKGDFQGMIKSRIFNFVFISKDRPLPFNPEITPDRTVTYDGIEIRIESQNPATGIRINQIGFYPDANKVAVITDFNGNDFLVKSVTSGEIVLKSTLSPPRKSEFSQKVTRIADFSKVTTPGQYILNLEGKGDSYTFEIKPEVFSNLTKALIKSFYFQRMSTPLLNEFAGKWNRPAGHPDNQVIVHPAAASPNRPAGTVISCPGGWYDAGDYNKYIVNSGITMGTLLSLYEDFPAFFDTLGLNIPESGNRVPDLLDEIIWNLRWMLTMQDPSDGGVYNKVTNAGFDDMVMPSVAVTPRYVVPKGTAATLDFAAVMAQSGRIFSKFKKVFPGLSDSCIKSAEKAWKWAANNPKVAYNQNLMNKEFKPVINTGGYGDSDFSDEFIWAASELYVTTGKGSYYTAFSMFPDTLMPLPSWNNVRLLGYYTLARFEKKLANSAKSDFPELRKRIIKAADQLTEGVNGRAYMTVMGKSAGDFVWGSNSVAANQGILLIQAFKLSKERKYLDYTLSNLDYILGRNATGYSFITGYGHKTPLFPHHRLSEADGIADPVPGLIVGGPNPGQQDGCKTYPSKIPDESYTDTVCSYASNEIAINWNAPAAYLAGALEALYKNFGKMAPER